jgi:hypothetical protein
MALRITAQRAYRAKLQQEEKTNIECLQAEVARLAGEILVRDAGGKTGESRFASWVSTECAKIGIENELGSVAVLIEKCATMKRELDFLEREREGLKSTRAEDYTIKSNLLARVAGLEAEKAALQDRLKDLFSAAEEVVEVARLRGEDNPPDDGRLWVSRWQNALATLTDEVDNG